MPSQPPEPPRRTQPRRPPFPELERDRGMARTTIATRWIAAGGIAGVGVFAGLAAISTHATATTPPATLTEEPAVTSTPATTAPATAATAPASTASPTAPAARTPATVAPSTTTPTVAPSETAPVQVPRSRRRAAASSGSS
jgi:hypothetical protein